MRLFSSPMHSLVAAVGFLFATLSTTMMATSLAAETPTVFADVEVKLDDAKLAAKGAGIRTLYITLYDGASQSPRPYGAMKVDLKQDAKGVVYAGKLDTQNIMTMGGGPTPKLLRIKARLDKDGSAGVDAPGDLVGIAKDVKLGAKVSIKIDNAL